MAELKKPKPSEMCPPGYHVVKRHKRTCHSGTDLIHIKYEDKFDPVVNIALGIRLLGHKHSQIPKGNAKNARNTLKMYNQWNERGEAYADEVLSRYRSARGKK